MSYEPSSLEKLFLKLVPLLLLVAAGLMVYTIVQLSDTNKTVAETEAYTRVTNCIVAASAVPQFTQNEIERCYVQVEKNTSLPLERFDKQTNRSNSPN